MELIALTGLTCLTDLTRLHGSMEREMTITPLRRYSIAILLFNVLLGGLGNGLRACTSALLHAHGKMPLSFTSGLGDHRCLDDCRQLDLSSRFSSSKVR